MDYYELIVIGGGPGGYLCAEKASAAGLSTALIEKNAVGGTCLNVGCIPTKALLNSAKLYRHAIESEAFGVTVQSAQLDHEKVLRHKDQVVQTLVSGVEMTLRRSKVTVMRGLAVIQGRTQDGFSVSVNGQEILGRRLVIATGSETAIPPIPGVQEGMASGFVITNRESLCCPELPKKLVVMGGGIIGLELASYYVDAGVKVTVVEMLPKIAGPIDSDICAVLQNEYETRGVEFKLSTKVIRVGGGKVVCDNGGKEESLECDRVLMALGRRPVTEGIGLENIGLEADRKGIKTDSRLRTNVPGVYAIGDCNGVSMLAHTAYREAEAVCHTILGAPDSVSYDAIPSVIYTDPEVATVGETKQSAEEKGFCAREIRLPLAFSGRYVAENNNGKGFIKLIVDTDKNRILGAHMIGSYAAEIIASAAMMIETELPIERLKKFVFPHPTIGEVIHNVLETV